MDGAMSVSLKVKIDGRAGLGWEERDEEERDG